MAYSGFAYLYDELNAAADYDRLCRVLIKELQANGIHGGIVADLGCGTGEVSLRLAAAGYDMIGVDGSEDMLAICREKLADRGGEGNILLLQQDLQDLDLFGTIKGAVSTFDTFNHLAPQQASLAIARLALFMEEGGIFLFDANTPYKHQKVLANNTFVYEDEGFTCQWQNQYLPDIPATQITVSAIEDADVLFAEQFLEYEYDRHFWENLLCEAALDPLWVKDGETFGALRPDSQRFLFCAQKL